MEIQLSDHFDYKRLIRFTLPSIASMIFTSVYGVVDGFFVSNFVGKIPFTGLNIIMPFIMMLAAVGNMIGRGGAALVGMKLGQGKNEEAGRLFSFFIYFMAFTGAVIGIIGLIVMPEVAYLLGARGEVLDNAIIYGRISMLGCIFFTMQIAMQSFLITAERPKISFYVTVAAGVTNMVLDALFIAVFRWGIVGAALATSIGEMVGGMAPFIMFASKKNNWNLKLGKTQFYGRPLVKACSNGLSEFLSSVSMSVIGMLYNLQLLKYAGEDGVAAYGVLMYVTMVFIAVYIGFTVGSAPLISFQYGAGNREELKNLFRKGSTIIMIFAVFMLVSAQLMARLLALVFTSYDEGLLEMTTHAFRIYSIGFLFSGIGIYGSALFTALNNGLISAIISVSRTVVMQAVFVFLLPLLLGLDGIWWSLVFAEALSAVIAVYYILKYRTKYGYM